VSETGGENGREKCGDTCGETCGDARGENVGEHFGKKRKRKACICTFVWVADFSSKISTAFFTARVGACFTARFAACALTVVASLRSAFADGSDERSLGEPEHASRYGPKTVPRRPRMAPICLQHGSKMGQLPPRNDNRTLD
jgi:hypothetical protein